MSRTFRTNPRSTWGKYDYGYAYDYCWYNDHNEVTYRMPIPYEGRLSRGGWKEAKRLLSKDQYAYLRICTGDKFTKYIRNGGVPWWFRHEIEKQHRFHCKRELHRFLRNPEYEPMVREKLDGVQWYYWY